MKQAKDHCKVNNRLGLLNVNQHETICGQMKGSQKLSAKKLMSKHLLAVALASRQGYKNVVHNELSFIHGFVDVNKYLGFCKFVVFIVTQF